MPEYPRQLGVLHGGASCVLAEFREYASNLCLDMRKQKAVGLELNATIRPVRSGIVTGITKPIALGKSVHVWSIEIFNEAGKMNCVKTYNSCS